MRTQQRDSLDNPRHTTKDYIAPLLAFASVTGCGLCLRESIPKPLHPHPLRCLS
jgi:hypothetical protein